MKKKIIIGLLIAGVFAVSIGGVMFGNHLFGKKQGSSVPVVTPTPTPEPLETWDDPAGFTFQYPKGLTIDKHDEDTEHYAHIEMTSSSHPGTIIVWAKDTNAASLDAWIKSDKTLKTASVLDTMFGGIAGKKIMIKDPIEKMIVGTISDQILFTIEMEPKEGEYWNSIFTTMTESFVFSDGAPVSGEGNESGGDSFGSVDEEETLE